MCDTSQYKIEEFQWEEYWERRPKGYWLQMNNQKKWLDDFAKKHNILNPEDWGKITSSQMKEFPSFYVNIYDASLFKMLNRVYPGLYLFYNLKY